MPRMSVHLRVRIMSLGENEVSPFFQEQKTRLDCVFQSGIETTQPKTPLKDSIPSESQRCNCQSPAKRSLVLSRLRCGLSTGIRTHSAVYLTINLLNDVRASADQSDSHFLATLSMIMVSNSLLNVLYVNWLLLRAYQPYVSRYIPTYPFHKFSMQLFSFFSERYPYNCTGSLCPPPLGPWSFLVVTCCWSSVVAPSYGDQTSKFRRTLTGTAGTKLTVLADPFPLKSPSLHQPLQINNSKSIAKPMNFPFSEKIRQLTKRLEHFETPDVTPYSHCSKLNNVLVVFHDVAQILSSLPLEDSNLTMKQLNALTSLYSVIEQFEELFRSCKRETCVQFLLSTPVTGPKYEINALRDAAASAFRQLDLPDAAKLFEISEQELLDQDMVDMKRIMQILIQVSLKKRADTKVDLDSRFESLGRLGLEVSQDDTVNITIPDLPENLRLVVTHEDVELGRRIGDGQSGTVYLGTMKATGEEAAVKVLYKRSLSQPELESFRREVFAMSILKHPSLLRFLGYTSEAPFYLITEYMANGSLFHMLRKTPELLSATRRSVIAWEVARGLEYLHGNGVIHRDLKSLNILLDKDNKAKICDFGMARTGRTDGPKTGMIGTAHWMAPEVLMSSPDYDQKVDVYSFGIFLWELLTGDLPYKDMKPADLILGVTMGSLRPVIPEGCPEKLRGLIEECWDQDPSVRPPMSKVVLRLQREPYHFPGTDEAEFHSLTGVIGKHKTSRSHAVNRPPESVLRKERASDSFVNSRDLGLLIQGIQDNAPDRVELTKLLASLLRNQETAEQIAEANGSHVFAGVLQDQQSALGLEVMKGLVKCRVPAFFDQELLEALLEYSQCPDVEKRQMAMRCLLHAGRLPSGALSSVPSFLSRLLGFVSQPLEDKLITELLALELRLIPTLEEIPPDLGKQLVAFWQDSKGFRKAIGQCILSVATSKAAASGILGQEEWQVLFENFDDAKLLLTKYINTNRACVCDKAFVSALLKFPNHDRAIRQLGSMVSKPRFTKLVLDHLPTHQPPEVASVLYKNLFLEPKNYEIMVKVPEFYVVLAYMVTTDDVKLACDVLTASKIDFDILLKTDICNCLAQSLIQTEDIDTISSILNVIASILQVKPVDELAELHPVFVRYLFGKARRLRSPAFLCVAMLSQHGVEGIEYSKVVPVAAYYANSEDQSLRSLAVAVVQNHLHDPGVDLDTTVHLFLGSYSTYHNGDTTAVLDTFAQALLSTRIDPNRAKQLLNLL